MPVPDSGSPLPDSGTRSVLVAGGAVREADPTKPALEGISPFALERLGRLFALGGVKYGDFRNWEKGMPVSRYYGAAFRHLLKWFRRDESEDHLAAVLWNVQAIMHHEAVGGVVSFSALDDRPRWAQERGVAAEVRPEWLKALK